MAIVEVTLWGKTIGAVTDENGPVRFSYARDFIGSGIELSPLMMPLTGRIYAFPELTERPYYGLPGMLSDSLPDNFGNKMISEYLKRYGNGRTQLSSVEKLCYVGERGMGALEYKPVMIEADPCEDINLSELTAIAERILSERKSVRIESGVSNVGNPQINSGESSTENTNAATGQIASLGKENPVKQLLQVGSSAGGARAKAVIAINEKTGEIRSGQINAGEGFGYYLLKFDRMSANFDRETVPDDIDATRIEYAYYLMALDAGIEMTESRLLKDGDCAHFLTRRFDRTPDGKKLHMQSLCGIAHLDFAHTHIYGYEQVAEIIYRMGLGAAEAEKFFRRMVFNDVTYNFDDHVKNTSFLMDKSGKWSLAPAYDVTFAHDPSGHWTNTHQMLINGKYIDIRAEDYLACGKKMGLKTQRIRNIVEQVYSATEKFADYAGNNGVRAEKAAEIKKLIDRKTSQKLNF